MQITDHFKMTCQKEEGQVTADKTHNKQTNKQIQPVRSLTFAFLITLLFSVEGILVSSAARKEPAVICYRVCQGVGLCVVFFSSIVLSLLYKVCLIGSTLVLGVIGYLVMEVSNNPVTPQENRAFSV